MTRRIFAHDARVRHGEQAKNLNLAITFNRADLDLAMMGASAFDDLLKAGKATFTGDRKPFDQSCREPRPRLRRR